MPVSYMETEINIQHWNIMPTKLHTQIPCSNDMPRPKTQEWNLNFKKVEQSGWSYKVWTCAWKQNMSHLTTLQMCTRVSIYIIKWSRLIVLVNFVNWHACLLTFLHNVEFTYLIRNLYDFWCKFICEFVSWLDQFSNPLSNYFLFLSNLYFLFRLLIYFFHSSLHLQVETSPYFNEGEEVCVF